MINEKKIAVVIKAYNEEKQITKVVYGISDFVDRIVVVNDGSKDKTSEVVRRLISENDSSSVCIPKHVVNVEDVDGFNKADAILYEMRQDEENYYPKHVIYNDNDYDRIVLIDQDNSGPGGAVSVGYKWCRDHNIDCSVVIDGDGQMDPNEMRSIVRPVISNGVDYVKGNRLSHPASKIIMPQIRYFGNNILSLLTKIASGYWTVSDTQTGYTAISLKALNSIPIHQIYHYYGYPNDILVKLNISNCIIAEVPIKPVYNIGEQSKMKILKVVPRISALLFKRFFERLYKKYLLDSFHPLFMLYSLGILLGIINIPVLIKIVYEVIVKNGSVPFGWYIIFLLLTLFSFQSICFGMWMDMQDNARLEK
ncbi:glycosyltransferase family 2 protein [Butyrivibrio sp. CB08]|uniref:glycosyltransferase family 2 protein n=1 Tax=Butyrivibrio sp. CB08 TaxID=2364879 RepID=UPI000EA8A908|nr:glycosyltransferase family 2 protein [Butyrivibrio sp. CB08]RKM57879.1 glycosyltransferase family 2 protein [Butyrivibrio sp. CB08]